MAHLAKLRCLRAQGDVRFLPEECPPLAVPAFAAQRSALADLLAGLGGSRGTLRPT